MAETTLMRHCGAELVSVEELSAIQAPAGTDTWHPIPHIDVLRAVQGTLTDAGYEIRKQSLSVAKEGHRFFGTLDLTSSIVDGISLAVGIRNSNDKTFPIGMVVGSRVFLCDNLAFHGEIVISKRHTRFGEERYREGISKAVASLGQYQVAQAEWISGLRTMQLTRQEADSIILRSFETDLIGARQLPLLIEEWRNPSHDEFRESTAWNLYNAFTAVLGKTTQATQPAKAAYTTIRLQGLFKKDVIDTTATKIEAV